MADIAVNLTLLATSLLSLCSACADVPRVANEIHREERCLRVGEIFIVGNTLTLDSVILRQIPFKQGDRFTAADLRIAKRNLARLQLFKDDPPPCIQILNREGEDMVKDICIGVCERHCNVYLYAFLESLEFADLSVRWGFFPAILHSDEKLFPLELIRYAIVGGKENRPIALSHLLYDLGLCK
jgi:hypothetical protein